MTEYKICTRCKIEQPLSSFNPIKGQQGKYLAHCKKCGSSAACAWQKANPEKHKEHAYAWDKRNPKKRKALNRAWRKENPEKCKESERTWKKENPAKCREKQKRSNTKQRATTAGRLNHRIGTAMLQSLKSSKKGRRWETLVGYTVKVLREHLEKLFTPGMSWDNMRMWHIDHKIPIAAFNFTCPEDIDFKKCWALSNLQPLWAEENFSKNAKVKAPFQPSLTLSV